MYFVQIGYDPATSENAFLILFFKVFVLGGLFISSIIVLPTAPSFICAEALQQIDAKLNSTKYALVEEQIKDFLSGKNIGNHKKLDYFYKKLYPKYSDPEELKNALIERLLPSVRLKTTFWFVICPTVVAILIFIAIAHTLKPTPSHSAFAFLAGWPIIALCIYILNSKFKLPKFSSNLLMLSHSNFLLMFVTFSWLIMLSTFKYSTLDIIAVMTVYTLYILIVSSAFDNLKIKLMLVAVFTVWFGFLLFADKMPTMVFKALKLREDGVSILIKPDACKAFNQLEKFQLPTNQGNYCSAKADLLFKGDVVSYIKIYNQNFQKAFAGSDKSKQPLEFYSKEFSNKDFDY
jgi:hypothetical protein